MSTARRRWGPALHRWHHARELAPPGKNFGTKLALWDYLFGTMYLPGSKPRSYGLEEPSYPRTGGWTWLEQHAYALLPERARSDGCRDSQPLNEPSQGVSSPP